MMVEIEAGESVGVGVDAAAPVVRSPALDVAGAGWWRYVSEQFIPTVARQGKRLRAVDQVGWRR